MIRYKLTGEDVKQAYKLLWRRAFRLQIAAMVLAFVLEAVAIALFVRTADVVSLVICSLLLAGSVALFATTFVRFCKRCKQSDAEYNLHLTETEVKICNVTAGTERTFAPSDVRYLVKNNAFIYLDYPDEAGKRIMLVIPNTYEADMATAPLARETTVERAIVQQRQKPLYNVGILLAVLSFLSFVGAGLIALLAGKPYLFGSAGVMRYLWVELCFLPLPIVTVVIGIFLRNDKHRFGVLLTCGVIAALLLLVMGTWGFRLDKDTFTRTNLTMVENKTGLTFPANTQVACNGTDSYREINAFVPQSDQASFAMDVGTDPRWVTQLPENTQKAMPNLLYLLQQQYTHFSCYNQTTRQFNGECAVGDECVFLCYNVNSGTLYVVYDYTVQSLLTVQPNP